MQTSSIPTGGHPRISGVSGILVAISMLLACGKVIKAPLGMWRTREDVPPRFWGISNWNISVLLLYEPDLMSRKTLQAIAFVRTILGATDTDLQTTGALGISRTMSVAMCTVTTTLTKS